MISIKIKCESFNEMANLRDEFCSALAGSPAFVESEIAVCEDHNDEKVFYLAVGNCNNHDLSTEINSKDIKILEEK